jgi:signal transduction histidine kinase
MSIAASLPRLSVAGASREVKYEIARIVSLALAAVTLAIAATVICGWVRGNATLCRFFFGTHVMSINTAAALAAASAALLVLRIFPRTKLIPAATGCALVILGGATLAEYAWSVSLGIDQLLTADWIGGSASPGRMAPPAAFHFVAAGCALALVNVRGRFARAAFQCIVATAIVLSAGNVAAALLHGHAFFAFAPFTHIAEQTAAAFLALDFALLFARADEGWISLLFTNTMGAAVARRLLPLALALPPLILAARAAGERAGGYDAAFGRAIETVALIAALAIVTLFAAKKIHVEDLARGAAEDELRQTYEMLASRYDALLVDKTAPTHAMNAVTLARQLADANEELEAFTYSVSHDLRAPLRALDGFSRELLERYGASVDETGKHYLRRVRAASQRMGQLIDDLLRLSRISRAPMATLPTDVTAKCESIVAELRERDPERQVEVTIATGMRATGDRSLLRIALENLLGNAWKFTSKREDAAISVTAESDGAQTVITVADNGAGFDPQYAAKLFTAFQRLHTQTEFDGSGIGLAIVRRVAVCHGGEVAARSVEGLGATFSLTLPAKGSTE